MKDEGVLSMEKLAAMLEEIRSGKSQYPIQPGRLPEEGDYIPPSRSHFGLAGHGFYGLRVHPTSYLPAEQPRKLTRWERFRVWVEDLADRAEVYYHYPRVKRTETAPAAYLIGQDLYIQSRALSMLCRFVS